MDWHAELISFSGEHSSKSSTVGTLDMMLRSKIASGGSACGKSSSVCLLVLEVAGGAQGEFCCHETLGPVQWMAQVALVCWDLRHQCFAPSGA